MDDRQMNGWMTKNVSRVLDSDRWIEGEIIRLVRDVVDRLEQMVK